MVTPYIETAPLPAGAQFLNVIESVFSGMARAIIHNSDCPSVEAAKEASMCISPREMLIFLNTLNGGAKDLENGARAKRISRRAKLQRPAVWVAGEVPSLNDKSNQPRAK
jgi:hypothetical protein